MRPRALVAAFLVLSGAFDLVGGAWAVADWRSAGATYARYVSDWRAQRDAASMAFADDALAQLWVNLGATLLVLGAAQLLAATQVARGRPAGDTWARFVAWSLVGAGALMAVRVPQLSSLVTEAGRGVVLLVLVTWMRTAEAEAAGPRAAGAGPRGD